jgi:hypothetical protein
LIVIYGRRIYQRRRKTLLMFYELLIFLISYVKVDCFEENIVGYRLCTSSKRNEIVRRLFISSSNFANLIRSEISSGKMELFNCKTIAPKPFVGFQDFPCFIWKLFIVLIHIFSLQSSQLQKLGIVIF